MRPTLPGGDTEPWYRQFWPWFIFLLPATVVVAGLATVYIANQGADDLVVTDYYRDGLAINRQLEKKQRSQELGISANLTFAGDKVTVQLTGPVDAGSLSLLLSHPMEADLDFPVTLGWIAPGIYQGALAGAVAPRWHWTLQLPQADGWRLDGSVEHTDISNVAGD
jgi:hypothetical protein